MQDWIRSILDEIRSHKLERTLVAYPELEESNAAEQGALLNFSSNDYLNLSRHSEVIAAARDISRAGSGASRLLTGTQSCHLELEAGLASHFGYESALLFGAGYLANLGLLSTLLGRNDVVFSDRLIHASLIDGITLSRADHMRYRHLDVGHLEELLSRAARQRSPGVKFLVVTDSVFSMDGDIAPLREIFEVAKKYDALMLVDEAHAIGVFGEVGRGLVHESGLQGKVDICTGTLSKALGAYGGFVLCSELMKQLLVNRSRPFIYNTALPPGVVRGALLALEVMRREVDLGAELLRRAKVFRESLRAAGLDLMNSTSQIVPLLVRENEAALRLSERLRTNGILSAAIRAPTVPKGTARLRFSVTLAHSEEALARAADVIAREVNAGRKQ